MEEFWKITCGLSNGIPVTLSDLEAEGHLGGLRPL